MSTVQVRKNIHDDGYEGSSMHKAGGRLNDTYELLNLRALELTPVNKIYIFHCVGKIFVEIQKPPPPPPPPPHTHTHTQDPKAIV